MHYYPDTTHIQYPVLNWVDAAPFEPQQQFERKQFERKAANGWTEFATKKDGAVDFFRVEPGPWAPTRDPISESKVNADVTSPISNSPDTSVSVPSNVHAGSDVAKIARQRVQLMAAKYASGVESSEIIARLEILNRRLLDRAPRVSQEQVIALEEANDQLARIRSAREERSKRMGMPVRL